MNKCKNPECGKEIPSNLNYCNQECLKRHIDIKKNKKEVITSNETESATEYIERKKKEKKLGIPKYTQSGFIRNTPEGIHEIKEICDVFGFKHTDGLVTGSHNATILGYLRQQQEGVYSTTIDKLTWVCHVSARCLKENYLKGIEAFGIIETFTNDFGVIKWRWIGIKALRNNGDKE